MNLAPNEQPPPQLKIETPPPATERWFLSLMLPGLGQFTQRRVLSGAGQLGTVVAYTATAIALGSPRALLLAFAWNVWSAIDAYRHDR